MAASPTIAAEALSQISPARRLKPLVLAKTSSDSAASPRRPSAAGGPLGGYRVLSGPGAGADAVAERPRRVSMADRPLIVQVSRPSPVDVVPTARRCSGSQRRRVSSGRVPPRARRVVPQLSSPAIQPMHFVLQHADSPAPVLDAGLLSSPDAPTPPLPSKLRGQRLRAPMGHGRRVRSETFAFPAPPADGLHGLGLGDIGPGNFASLHRRPMPRLRLPPSPAWTQDATEWVNRLSPLAAASSSEECGLTGAQGWSPDSSLAPSPSALPSNAHTAPLSLQKRDARRVVSQPAPPPALSDDDDEAEPEEYPFPLVPASQQQRPSFGLLHLPADISETRAPSLAEQMAFACGLGSDLEWETAAPKPAAVARPASQVYTSAAAYLTHSYGASDDERPLSADVEHSWTGRLQSDSEEDEAAFWRAPAAAQSALSRSNTVTSTFTADSPILSGHLAADSGASSDELSSPRSAFSSSGVSDASSATSHGVHSMRDFGDKAQQPRQAAPAFSPVEIDRLFHKGLLTPLAPCTPQLVEPELSHNRDSMVALPGSPGMLAEFQYLLAGADSSPDTVACGMFSPALDDAELDLPTTPAPLEQLPSPTPAPGAFPFAAPALSLISSASAPAPASARYEDARLLRSATAAPTHMFKSASSASIASPAEAPTSVLSRPRPGTRRSTFFGGAGSEMGRAQTPPKVIVLQPRRPSGSPNSSSTASPRPSIPGRRSSLECKQVATEAPAPAATVVPSRNSPEAFWQETKAELAACTAAALPKAAALPTAASAPQLDVLAGASRPRRVPVPSISALELLGGSPAKSAGGMSRSRSELLPPTGPTAGVLSPRAMAEVREACRQKQAFLRAAAAAAAAGPSSMPRPASAGSSTLSAPSPRSVRFSQEVVRPAPTAMLSPTSILKPARPMSAQSAPPRSHAMVSSASLPTLFVARSHSQRRRGVTGVPETEPTAQALAKLGLNVGRATRTSTVRAVSGAAAPAAPSGIILVVEEVVSEEERCLVRL